MKQKPKNTDQTLSETKYPGAKNLAGPKHKAVASDLNMNVDGQKESYVNTAPATQVGGHNRKK